MSKKTYEHKAVEGTSSTDVVEKADELGRGGWEMVSVIYDSDARKYVAFLKRKVRQGKSSD